MPVCREAMGRLHKLFSGKVLGTLVVLFATHCQCRESTRWSHTVAGSGSESALSSTAARGTSSVQPYVHRLRLSRKSKEVPTPKDIQNPCKRLLWFMGLRASPLSDYFVHVKAALMSAKFNAPSLVPHLIFSGAANDLTAWYEEQGGKVLFHDLSFFDILPTEMKSQSKGSASGPYLRLDIPDLVKHRLLPLQAGIEANFALYTDTDVLFMRDFDSCSLERPGVISIGGEFQKGSKANTGVMYMNLEIMAKRMADLVLYAQKHTFDFPAHDQGLILSFFQQDELTQLPDDFNWKGYWGPMPTGKPYITHFHGLKPNRGLECLLENNLTSTRDEIKERCFPQAKFLGDLFFNAPDNGAYYNDLLQYYQRMVLHITH